MNRLIVFTCLLMGTACSRHPGAPTDAPDPAATHPRLAADFFGRTNNFEIPHQAGIFVDHFVKDNDDAALKLPRPWRAVYTTYALETEAGNGGFTSFFLGSRGKLDNATEEDLAYIGATPFVSLFTEARGAFYNAQLTQAQRQQQLARLDAQFDQQPRRISDYLRLFMKTHPTLFTE